jgi:hypothetical protein
VKSRIDPALRNSTDTSYPCGDGHGGGAARDRYLFNQQSDVVAAAQERGRARDPWATAQELLEELERRSEPLRPRKRISDLSDVQRVQRFELVPHELLEDLEGRSESLRPLKRISDLGAVQRAQRFESAPPVHQKRANRV